MKKIFPLPLMRFCSSCGERSLIEEFAVDDEGHVIATRCFRCYLLGSEKPAPAV